MFRILAVEPEPQRGRYLADLVRGRIDADIVVVRSADDAIAAIVERTPDIILTAALLSPSDDAQLADYLRQSALTRALPVLTIPPVVDPEATKRDPGRRVFSFRRRGAPPWPAYDPDLLVKRIEDALRDLLKDRESAQPVHDAAASVWTMSEIEGLDETSMDDSVLQECGLGIKRLRAHRFSRTDLPWLSQIHLSWGLEVQLLNISSSGVLIESGSKLDPGSATTIHLSGLNKQLVVPARVVRSHVATVDMRGVRYASAAAFDKDIELLTQRPVSFPRSVPVSTALADLLSSIVQALAQGKEPAVLRATFEHGLRRLVGAREIEIQSGTAPAIDDGESITFPVPFDGPVPTILRATFEPSCQPREEEFRILKAAATLAGFILQFADIAPVHPELLVPPPDAVVNTW
jgi:CheY-like chemotaxis protein